MPVLYLSYFTPSDALLADHDLLRAQLQVVANADGCLGVYQGLGIDDTNRIAVYGGAWESLKHLGEFLARNPDKIADLTESSKPAMDSPLKIVYANCTENPTTTFEAPFTKVYIGTAKEGRTTEELMGLALKVTSDPTALANQKGRVSQPIWGEAVESPGSVLCISGWDSVGAADAKQPESQNYDKIKTEILDGMEGVKQLMKFSKVVAWNPS